VVDLCERLSDGFIQRSQESLGIGRGKTKRITPPERVDDPAERTVHDPEGRGSGSKDVQNGSRRPRLPRGKEDEVQLELPAGG